MKSTRVQKSNQNLAHDSVVIVISSKRGRQNNESKFLCKNDTRKQTFLTCEVNLVNYL